MSLPPLYSVLPGFAPFLRAFRSVFSGPQRRHFVAYLDALSRLDAPATAVAIARSQAFYRHPCNVRRFVTTAPWYLDDAERVGHRTLRRHFRTYPLQGHLLGGKQTVFLILDDTQVPKAGLELEGTDFHYSATKKQFQRGYQPFLAVYRVGRYTFSWRITPYLREKTVSQVNQLRRWKAREHPGTRLHERSFYSKIDLALEVVRDFTPLQRDRTVCVLFDSWYCSQEVVRACEKKQWLWCSRLKSNRKLNLLSPRLDTASAETSERLAVSELQTRAEERNAEVPQRASSREGKWTSCTVKGSEYRYVSYRARVGNLGEAVVVLCQRRSQAGGWSAAAMLVSNAVHWTGEEVLIAYLERSSIEIFIRDIKQETGLGASQVADLSGAEAHWWLATLAAGWLTVARHLADIGQWVDVNGEPVATLGNSVRWAKEWLHGQEKAQLVGWVYRAAESGRSRAELVAEVTRPHAISVR